MTCAGLENSAKGSPSPPSGLASTAGLERHLANYHLLRARVEELCRRVEAGFAAHIACRRGCDACCRHLTLLPVEGFALAQALRLTEPQAAAAIRERARRASAGGPCPLLADGACLLYAGRPIICRTHGLPLLVPGDGGGRIDFCPENFCGLATLPGEAVIDLERLNAALTAVDALFVEEALAGVRPRQGRLALAEALLLDLG